jgi:hypothetical protein
MFIQCGNKLTRVNGSDLMGNMRALREQLLGLTQYSNVKPKTIVRKPKQWEREPQTQEEWDDVGNSHPIRKPQHKATTVRKPKLDGFGSFEDYMEQKHY